MNPLDLYAQMEILRDERNTAIRRAVKAESLVAKLTDIAQRHTCNIGQAPSECEACVEADDAIREGLEVGKV